MARRLLALGGSYRVRSLTNSLLHEAASLARQNGAEADCRTVADLGLGMFDPDTTDAGGPAVAELLASVSRADALLIATPIYGGTPSGAVKNVLDTLHLAKAGSVGPLEGKTVVVAAVGGGALSGTYDYQRGATGTLDIACKNLGAWVDPHHLEFSELYFSENGRLQDSLARDALRSAVRRLTDQRGRTSPPRASGASAAVTS